MIISQLFRISVLVLIIPVLSGCWLLAAGGAGAYGGYKAKEEGYTVQNPIKKERQDTKEKDKPAGEQKKD